MVHSVVLSICPGVRIVDLCHEVPAHDVRAGAALLRRAAPYLAPGVLLAVVDPGVGGPRRRVVVDCGPVTLVGPDNGLLPPAADVLGGPRAVVDATDPSWWLPGRAATFDGRDVFGPLAAHVAAGADPASFGPAVDPAGLVRLPPPEVRPLGAGGLVCEVVAVDRFGNVELAARPEDLPAGVPDELHVTVGGGRERARRVASFAQLEPGQLGLLADSAGQLALVLDRASAAARLAVAPGDRIEIAR